MHKDVDSFCEPRNFSRVLCLLGVGWLGEVNLRKSVTDFYHRFVCDDHVVHLFDHQS